MQNVNSPYSHSEIAADLKGQMSNMKYHLLEVISDLETMPDVDETADKLIIECIKKLDQIVSNGEIEPIKKKKSKK